MHRSRLIVIALALAALAVTPVVHHHPLGSPADGDAALSLQTVCAVCIHAGVVLPPDAGAVHLLTVTGDVMPLGEPAFDTVSPPLVPSRGPPHTI